MAKNKFYITTAIDYINGKPHIGHAFEKVVADVMARYKRQHGFDVFFSTGTDEHGMKIEQKAKAEGITPQEWADNIVVEFQNFKKYFNLSYDEFIRTTDPRHEKLVQELWMRCKEKGDIYKKSYSGLYCVGCEGFVKENDLVDGKCPYHDKAPDIVEEENWFFRLSNYRDSIIEKITSDEYCIYPLSRKNEILNVLKEIEDFSISRPRSKVSWGISIPDDNEQTMYVWFDALTNYLTCVDYDLTSERFQKYWPADIHMVGKDISKFHAIFWPAMLMSMGYELPKRLLIHGMINAEGSVKMSKSIGNVIYCEDVIEKYGTDPARYFLIREIPLDNDGSFSWTRFEERYDNDLANSLGNLVSRVTNIAEKNEIKFQNQELSISIEKEIDGLEFDKALEKIWEKIYEANKYVDESRPWEIKDDPEKLSSVINNLLNSIRSIGEALIPFMPETSEKILKIFDGEKIIKAEPLFPKKEK